MDGEDLGWVAGDLVPRPPWPATPTAPSRPASTPCSSTPAMNFAINAALPGRDRTRGTLEIKTETMRPARLGAPYRRPGRGGAHGPPGRLREATVRDDEGSW